MSKKKQIERSPDDKRFDFQIHDLAGKRGAIASVFVQRQGGHVAIGLRFHAPPTDDDLQFVRSASSRAITVMTRAPKGLDDGELRKQVQRVFEARN